MFTAEIPGTGIPIGFMLIVLTLIAAASFITCQADSSGQED